MKNNIIWPREGIPYLIFSHFHRVFLNEWTKKEGESGEEYCSVDSIDPKQLRGGSKAVLNIGLTVDGVLLTPHRASSKQRHVANLPRGAMPRAASSRGRHKTVPFGVKQIVLLFVK